MVQPRSLDQVNVPAAVYHRITMFVATVPLSHTSINAHARQRRKVRSWERALRRRSIEGQGGRPMQPSTENLPWTFTHLTKPWHRSHPRFVVRTQLLVAAWMVVLGVILLSIGDWPGVLLFVGAGLLLWFLYEFQRGINMLADSAGPPAGR
jgi:hypothetical protein